MFVEVSDIGCGFLECFTQSRIQAVVSRVYLFAADFKCRIAEIVELPAVEAQCRIAVLLYISICNFLISSLTLSAKPSPFNAL